MAGEPMANAQPLSSETLALVAERLVGTPVGERELSAVAALLNGLTSEMAPMRAMEVRDAEPATTYDPREP